MPQQSLLPDIVPDMHDLRITLRRPYDDDHPLTIIVAVARKRDDPPMPIWVGTLEGTASDYLNTLVSEAVMAWAYGQRPKDVMIACTGVRKQARAHAALHDF